MRDDSYYIVHGWMINKLKLKGTSLQLYAIIYGFSHDGESECSGSLTYLAEMTGCTKQTVLNALNKLEKIGYIRKRQTRDSDGGLRNHYCASTLVLCERGIIQQSVENDCGKDVESKAEKPKNFTPVVKKLQSPQSKNHNAPSQKIRPNNNIREYIDYELCVRGAHTQKEKFGEFANVWLTADEYKRLQSTYGDQFCITLSSLSSYMASTGKSYKNHYATLFRWCKQDKQKAKSYADSYGEYRKKDVIPISPMAEAYASLVYNTC